jgi:hypothetical protein
MALAFCLLAHVAPCALHAALLLLTLSDADTHKMIVAHDANIASLAH